MIEAEPARMSVIKLSDYRGKEAFISEEEFRGNTTTTEEIQVGLLDDEAFGLDKLYWLILGICGGAVGILMVMGCVINFLCKPEAQNRGISAGLVISNTFVAAEQPATRHPRRSLRDSFKWKKQIMDDPFQLKEHTTTEEKPNTLARIKTLEEQQAELHL